MTEVCLVSGAKQFSIVVLAGGQSRRMGRDKAALFWKDGDILGSLITRLLPLSDDVLVVSNTVRTIGELARQVADIIPGKGPLSGIHAGLIYARHDLVFVTACDVPFLVPELVPELVHAVGLADGSVVVYKEQIEPLFACYRKGCAAVIEQLLAEEQYRITDLLAQINWVAVRQLDDLDECCFMNINTRNDYEKAKAILAKGR
ncbi:MAG: Molybdopterin-guanine dinucleotide biosynthesis protein [Firmicutes bacterium]|nr:Molybdopterin-guanine dinucleotide biosynthesis protein [Bacillota bacterium]